MKKILWTAALAWIACTVDEAPSWETVGELLKRLSSGEMNGPTEKGPSGPTSRAERETADRSCWTHHPD